MEITHDFCMWLQRNFDAIVDYLPEWHAGQTAPVVAQSAPKPQMPAHNPAPVPITSAMLPESYWDVYMKQMEEIERKRRWWQL